MTQRNPMNERYTTENRKGTTRKSAASARPATRAAASVHMESTPKKGRTAKERKAAEKAQREKEREINAVLERKYYNPPSAEYRRARAAWAILLVLALLCTFGTWLVQGKLPAMASYAMLFVAYAGIVGVLLIDFKWIRKLRKEYTQAMSGEIAKDRRALEKAQKDAEWARARGQKVEEGYLSKAIEMPEHRGFFSRRKKSDQADGETSGAADENGAAK